MDDDTENDAARLRSPDRRPFGKRDIRVNRPYREQSWELSPDEIGQVKWLLWIIAACIKGWGALVIGVLTGTAPIWVPLILHLLKGQ